MILIVSWASSQVSVGWLKMKKTLGMIPSSRHQATRLWKSSMLDLLADDLPADPVRAGLQAERQMEEPGLLHLFEERAAHEVEPDVALEEDVELPLDHQVADGVDPLRAGVEGVVEEEDDLDPALADGARSRG